MSSARDELTSQLGGLLTPGLAALNKNDLDALASAISDAKRQQKSALTEAINNGLAIVPPILRGAVRKALFR